jgi:hypothetical protein
MIPAFQRGFLPPGVHHATWDEMVSSLGTSAQRQSLIVGLEDMCRHLRAAGATYVWLDGSFASRKPRPNDYDLCYSIREVDPRRLDACFFDMRNEREAMKRRFLGEAWADDSPSGLPGITVLEMFQLIKGTRKPKGIVKLDLGTLP